MNYFVNFSYVVKMKVWEVVKGELLKYTISYTYRDPLKVNLDTICARVNQEMA